MLNALSNPFYLQCVFSKNGGKRRLIFSISTVVLNNNRWFLLSSCGFHLFGGFYGFQHGSWVYLRLKPTLFSIGDPIIPILTPTT